MVKIIDRRKHAIGGQSHNRSESAIKKISWHYTAVARSSRSFITNHEDYWRNTLGWNRGGYHFYIDADGNIYQNYDLTTQSNGVKYHNHNTVHISVEANSASDYSQAQIDARQELTLWLMDRLNIPASRVLGHKEFSRQSTACPGYTKAQMNAFRKQLANGKSGKVTTSTSKPEKAPKPKPTGQKIHLPASASSWRIYKQGGPYTKGNEINFIKPSKFGGLSYDIVGNPVKDVYLINTRDFGTVAIYGAKSTGANITGSGAGNQKPEPSPAKNKELHLPATAKKWRIYNTNGPYTKAHAIHQLTPSRYDGLTYEIKGSPAPDVYLIDTGVKGRVAIYAAKGTGATITGKKKIAKPKPKRKQLHLPASAKTWRIYNVNGPYTTGNEIHKLTPSRFGGITYDILEDKGNHVYIINTGVKGKVAIYAAPSTGAKIT